MVTLSRFFTACGTLFKPRRYGYTVSRLPVRWWRIILYSSTNTLGVPLLPAPRKPPPSWWLLGYLAQYQPQALLTTLEKTGLPADHVYQAAAETAKNLPSQDYRRLSKTWAVRRLRYRKIPKPE